MNQSIEDDFSLKGTKKRRMMPNELFGRFSAKSDFIKYFKEGCKFPLRFLIFSIQCNYTFHQTICWTKTFSRKFSSTRRDFSSSTKSTEYVCLCTMSCQWSSCGPWWGKTRSSCSSFPPRCPRAEFLTESISSIFSTLSKESTSNSWLLTHKNSATKPKERQELEKLLRYLRSGGTSFKASPSFRVSQNFFLCSNHMILSWNRTQGKDSPLAEVFIEASASTTKTTQAQYLGHFWWLQSCERRAQTKWECFWTSSLTKIVTLRGCQWQEQG